MAFRRKIEVICDHEGPEGKCTAEGYVMATSKEDANHKLVVLGWSYYDQPPKCTHFCPAHNASHK